MTATTRRIATVTCPSARSRDPDLIDDLQAYLTLFCRCRALVEVGEQGVAVHFERAGEAAAFAEVWDAWVARGLVVVARNPDQPSSPQENQ